MDLHIDDLKISKYAKSIFHELLLQNSMKNPIIQYCFY